MTQVVTFEDTDPVVQYHPSIDVLSTSAWSTIFDNGTIPTISGATQGVGNSVRRTAVPGSSFKLQFYGNSIQLFGMPFGSVYTVEVDGNPAPTTVDGGLLADVQGLQLGHHTLVLTVTQPSPYLDFDRAAFDVGQTPLGNTTIHHESGWTYQNDWMVNTSTKPSLDENQTVHVTWTAGSWASVPFQGSAVVLYGNLMPDHGLYQVELDGSIVQLNGRAGTLVQRSVMYFAAGLDPAVNHTLTLRNLENFWLDIDHIDVLSLEPPPSPPVTTVLPKIDAPPRKHPVGAIVGGVVGGVVFLLLCIFLILFCIHRRSLRRRAAHRRTQTPPRPFDLASTAPLPVPPPPFIAPPSSFHQPPPPPPVYYAFGPSVGSHFHPSHGHSQSTAETAWFPSDTYSMYQPSSAPDVLSDTVSEAPASRWGRERRWAEGVTAMSERGGGGAAVSVVSGPSGRTRDSGMEGSIATTDTGASAWDGGSRGRSSSKSRVGPAVARRPDDESGLPAYAA